MSSNVQNEVQQAAVALRENRVNEALGLLQNSVALAPGDFTANHLFGVALGKAGRRPESIARLLTATRLNPSSAAAQTHLGLAYAAADKTDLARRAYEAALSIDPNFAPAQAGMSRLPAPSAAPAPPPVVPLTAPAPVPAAAPTAPTPWSPSASAPQSPVKVTGKPAIVTSGGDKSLWDEVNDAKKKAKEEAKYEKTSIDWGPMMLQAGGALVFVGGILLKIGNITGMFPTFPFAGYLTMLAGAAMWKAA